MAHSEIGRRVLFEDNHLLIVNKMPGELVQGDKTGDKPLVEICKDYLKKKYDKPGKVFLGVPHRLDRPVSGIVIFSRTSKSLTRMSELFKNKNIEKTYWAVVNAKPKMNREHLIHYLVRKPKQNKSYAHDRDVADAKKAELIYQVLGKSDRYYLLEIDLLTGRHHQIRSQLSKVGMPIKGDLKYGFDRSNKDASIHLHARKIRFLHPTTKESVEIVAAPPKDPLWDYYIKALS